MNRIPQTMFLLIFCGLLTHAQAQTYQLTVSNEPFVFLENAQLAVDGAWDSPFFQLPIGFDFEFFDITSDQLYSAENTFGGYTSLNQDEDHLYMLVHFYALLIDRGYPQDSALSPIYYKTEGLAGQRVFTLEYNHAGLFFGPEDENAILLDYINLQVKLYEATGDIEFHYGPHSIQEDPEIVFQPFPGPIVGLLADLENTPGGHVGEFILLEGNPLKPTIVTDSLPTFLDWPIPENTVYRFSRMDTSVGDQLSAANQPLFSPNPTSGYIKLNDQIANDIIYPVIILDAHGKQAGLWSHRDEISVSNFPAGCYYVTCRTHDGVFTEKLIVLPR